MFSIHVSCICIILYYQQQMHTIISQIITLLHVSTLLCHTQGTCNQCFQNMYRAFLLFCAITNKCTQLFHKLSHCYMFRHYRVIVRELVINAFKTCTRASFVILCCDQQMHKIISQIITLLHVSTLSCHPQGACNQCFQYMYTCIFCYFVL